MKYIKYIHQIKYIKTQAKSAIRTDENLDPLESISAKSYAICTGQKFHCSHSDYVHEQNSFLNASQKCHIGSKRWVKGYQDLRVKSPSGVKGYQDLGVKSPGGVKEVGSKGAGKGAGTDPGRDGTGIGTGRDGKVKNRTFTKG